MISFLSSGLIFHYQNIKKETLKKIFTLNFQNHLHPKWFTKINCCIKIIHNTNVNGLQLYYYEDNVLKYASDINKPNIKLLLENTGKSEIERFVDDSRDGLIGKIGKSNIVVISHEKNKIINAISLFSYIFTILILFSYLINILNNQYQFLPPGIQFSLSSKPSLRTKIQFYIILGIVLSFVIIAAVTVFLQSEQIINYNMKTSIIKQNILAII